MGADIHCYCEKKDNNGIWRTADKWVKNKYYDPKDPECGEQETVIECHSRLIHHRNYDLFAILADVRNGRGFAGCDTGDGFKPISPPKGLPDDVSPEVKADSDRWSSDGHSHSFLTLAELLAYDWTQETKKRGVVNGPVYWDWESSKEYRDIGEGPREYSGGVEGPSVRNISIGEMVSEVQKIQKNAKNNKVDHQEFLKELRGKLGNTFCTVQWGTPYYAAAGELWGCTIPRLLKMAGGDHDGVRLVFWFDN